MKLRHLTTALSLLLVLAFPSVGQASTFSEWWNDKVEPEVNKIRKWSLGDLLGDPLNMKELGKLREEIEKGRKLIEDIFDPEEKGRARKIIDHMAKIVDGILDKIFKEVEKTKKWADLKEEKLEKLCAGAKEEIRKILETVDKTTTEFKKGIEAIDRLIDKGGNKVAEVASIVIKDAVIEFRKEKKELLQDFYALIEKIEESGNNLIRNSVHSMLQVPPAFREQFDQLSPGMVRELYKTVLLSGFNQGKSYQVVYTNKERGYMFRPKGKYPIMLIGTNLDRTRLKLPLLTKEYPSKSSVANQAVFDIEAQDINHLVRTRATSVIPMHLFAGGEKAKPVAVGAILCRPLFEVEYVLTGHTRKGDICLIVEKGPAIEGCRAWAKQVGIAKKETATKIAARHGKVYKLAKTYLANGQSEIVLPPEVTTWTLQVTVNGETRKLDPLKTTFKAVGVREKPKPAGQKRIELIIEVGGATRRVNPENRLRNAKKWQCRTGLRGHSLEVDMTLEQQLCELKQAQKRQSRIVAVLGVVLVVILTAGAAAALEDLACGSLVVKDKTGDTQTSFESNGNANIGGQLKVKGEIQSPTVVDLTKRLEKLQSEVEANKERLPVVVYDTRTKFPKGKAGTDTFELDNKYLSKPGLYEVTLTMNHPTADLIAAMRCLVYVNANNPKQRWVLCESKSKTVETLDFEVIREPEARRGVPPTTAIKAHFAGGTRWLKVTVQRISNDD